MTNFKITIFTFSALKIDFICTNKQLLSLAFHGTADLLNCKLIYSLTLQKLHKIKT